MDWGPRFVLSLSYATIFKKSFFDVCTYGKTIRFMTFFDVTEILQPWASSWVAGPQFYGKPFMGKLRVASSMLVTCVSRVLPALN